MIADVQLIVAQVLWDVLLLLVIVAVVPLVVHLAHRLVRASRSIAIHFEVTEKAAVGIVGNTSPTTPALNQTISLAGELLETAAAIDQHSSALEQLLSQRAVGEGVR